MRIGMVTGEYPPMQGGVGAYTDILVRTLAGQGHEVFVYAGKDAVSSDSRVVIDQRAERWTPGVVRRIARWADERRLDIVNMQYQTAAYAMSPWVHFLPDLVRNVPVVTTFHDLRFPYLFPKAGPLRLWIVRHLTRASTGCIVTNHEDALALKQLPHVALIPIGSNITERTPPGDLHRYRQRAGAAPDDLLIAYFGFANRSKGLDVLLRSLARLRADGLPARLVIIGGRTGSSDPTNATYASELDALIAELGLTGMITYTGFVPEAEVAGFLAASDATALPFLDGASYRRGTLMAAIEHGCAIVTTEPAVPVPTFVDGENMLLVPPGNVTALANALSRLYHSPDLRERLRHGARALRPLFDWSRIARDTVAFFEQIRRR